MTKLFLFYFLQGARTRTKYQVNPDDIPGVVQFLIVFGQDFAHFLNPISDGVRGDFEFFSHIRGRIVLLYHLQAAVHRLKNLSYILGYDYGVRLQNHSESVGRK